jgi:hypothetical protein
MTAMAHCPVCGYPFATHLTHPVTPAHQVLGTDMWCAGASQPALTEMS